MALIDRVVGVEASPDSQGVTGRSIVVGLMMALGVILWNTYVEYIAHTARMNITHFPIALFIPYVLLTLGNALLRRKQVAWALGSTEVWTILAMGMVGAAVPAYGLTSYFLGLIAIPYYLATPENQWANYFHQYLPNWLIPTNEGGAMQWLLEGMPSPDMPIPWGVWFVPLFGWMTFIGAIVVGCLCLAIILRKQWAENERLAYPILQPAGDLADAESRVALLNNKFFIFTLSQRITSFRYPVVFWINPFVLKQDCKM